MAERLTVIIPVFNREHCVLSAIQSCLTQSATDIEVIVVDDSSTDGTVGVVESIDDPRLKLIKLPENIHVGPARNAGAKVAKGQWILELDSDDELPPGALDTLLSAVSQHPEVDGVLFPHLLDDGTTAPTMELPEKEVWGLDDYLCFLEAASPGNNSGHFMLSASGARKVPYSEVKPFLPLDELYRNFKFIARSKILTLSTPLYLYHQHSASISGSQRRPETWVREASRRSELIQQIQTDFGRDLIKLYPTGYRQLSQNRYVSEFTAGRRGAGISAAFHHLSKFPTDFKVWPAMIVGLMGPKAFGAARERRNS